jgi:hypothetical protein
MQLIIRYTLASNPLGTWWADSTPFVIAGWEDATLADLDNFSSEEVIQPVIQLAKEADALYWYFKILDDNAPIGPVARLLDEVSRWKGQEQAYELNGPHPGMERLLKNYIG